MGGHRNQSQFGVERRDVLVIGCYLARVKRGLLFNFQRWDDAQKKRNASLICQPLPQTFIQNQSNILRQATLLTDAVI